MQTTVAGFIRQGEGKVLINLAGLTRSLMPQTFETASGVQYQNSWLGNLSISGFYSLCTVPVGRIELKKHQLSSLSLLPVTGSTWPRFSSLLCFLVKNPSNKIKRMEPNTNLKIHKNLIQTSSQDPRQSLKEDAWKTERSLPGWELSFP